MSDTSILISVIMPVYNNEAYVQAALQSLFTNIDEQIEVIIVNDGSTDATHSNIVDFLQQHPHPHVTYLTQENKGVAHARNVGLQHATGTYLAFMDADDLLHPNYWPILLPLLQPGHYDLIEFPLQRFNIPYPDFSPIQIPQKKAYSIEKTPEHLLPTFKKSYWHMMTRIFKRSLITEVNLFPIGRRYEDVAVMPFIYLNPAMGNLLRIETPLYFYRTHPTSITQNVKPQDPLDMLYAMNKMVAYLKQYPSLEKNRRQAAILMIINAFSEARLLFRRAHGGYQYDQQSLTDIQQALTLISGSKIDKKIYYRMRYPAIDGAFYQLRRNIQRLRPQFQGITIKNKNKPL